MIQVCNLLPLTTSYLQRIVDSLIIGLFVCLDSKNVTTVPVSWTCRADLEDVETLIPNPSLLREIVRTKQSLCSKGKTFFHNNFLLS